MLFLRLFKPIIYMKDIHQAHLKNLMQIPGVGKSIAQDLINIGVKSVDDLKGRSPDELYNRSNKYAGAVQE